MRSRATSAPRATKSFSSLSTKSKRLLGLVAVALVLAGAFVPGLGAVAGLEGNLLILAVILTVSVGLHEFGHLVMARLLHLCVDSYGLFMGPRVVSRREFGIEWRLNILPIGGYVTLEGENRDGNVEFGGAHGCGDFREVPAHAQIAVEVSVDVPPPPLPYYEQPPIPAEGYIWAPGYWGWNGGWVWIGGRYVVRPRPTAVWMDGHWSRHGHGYIWIGGGWR